MRAWEFAFSSAGGEWDYDFIFSLKGMSEKEVVDLYNSRFARPVDREAIVRVKAEYFLRHTKEFTPIEKVVDVARSQHGRRALAVASGSVRETVVLELTSIGIIHLFDVIVTADDGFKPKPAPDIFLEAARRIKVPPHLCAVFEDSDLGLEAAGRAGMQPIHIRTSHTWFTDLRLPR